ncbi:MAG: polyketide synthase, partial [Armatimonadetes bacterium]|nr:polyketide synthase [Anaerolineae bacterium]
MSAYHDPIAVIGMGCLFPDAATPDDFWRNLTAGRSSTSPATADQFGADPALYYDPQRRQPDTTYFMRGGYVRGFTPSDALPAALDNSYHWSHYVAHAALTQSGYLNRPDILARCGLILGNLSFPTRGSHRLTAPLYDAALQPLIADLLGAPITLPRSSTTLDSRNANISGGPAAVVAAALGLGATHFALDAACASSLYAVSLACDMLAAGKADLMLAGAVNAADPLFVNFGFMHFGAYPEQGDSRPLDAESGGLIAGEGAGMLVLKRHADALRDGDAVLAVIKSIGLSNDGRGKHPLTPNPRGQILAFQRAYADGGIDPALVQYVECHASGTPLGDKTELNALEEFFGGRAVAPLIGSVKSNVGHLLTAAGMASMLKVILAMAHNTLPATINVQQPLHSHNHTFGAPQIVTQQRPWNAAEKLAGINAFGFGGVNAHAVIADTAPLTTPTTKPTPARLAI